MAELIVVGFKQDMYRASEVLNTLQDMNSSWVVDLHDAVAVYRDYNGKLRVDQSYQMTSNEGAAWGGLFGRADRRPARSAVHGRSERGGGRCGRGRSAAARSVPRAGAIDASSWKEDFGISDDFVQTRGHDDPARRLGDLRPPAHDRPGRRGRAVPRLRRNHPAARR